MGFNRTKLHDVPCSFLVSRLGADISHLISVGIGLLDMANAGYTASDLLSLKCVSQTLINMGLSAATMARFCNIAPAEWAILGLQCV